MTRWIWLWLLIAGLGLGHSIWTGIYRYYSDRAPPSWEKENSPVPYRQSSLQGDLKSKSNEWTLDFYQSIYPKTPKEPNTSIFLDFRMSPASQLEIWLSAPPIQRRFGDRWLSICNMVKHPPSFCHGLAEFGVGLVIDRFEGSSVQLVREDVKGRKTISCSEKMELEITEEPISISLEGKNNTVFVDLNGKEYQCKTELGDKVPLIRPGLRSIAISNLRYGDLSSSNLPSWVPVSSYLFGLLFLLGFGWLEKRSKASNLSLFLTSTPAVLAWLFADMNAKILIEDLRASWLSAYWLPFYLSFFPTVFFKLSSYSLRSERQNQFVKIGIGLLVLFLIVGYSFSWLAALSSTALLIVALFLLAFKNLQKSIHIPLIWVGLISMFLILVEPFHWSGLFWGTIWALSWSLLLLVNRFAKQIPWFNWLSILFCISLLVSSEVVLRATKAGQQWSNTGSQTEANEIFGWVRQANESFALFEEGEHRDYPDKGFPAPIETQNKKTRVIAFGGSTTGGAFQNDDLNEFYPARLQDNLGNQYQVLNQGVGGWTTWHIRYYIQAKQEKLSPDVVLLYVGHNDILTAIPLPYKQLYQAWKTNKSNKAIGDALGQFRLYHAFRHILLSLRSSEKKVAVPTDHAKENLEAIISMLGEERTVILISEGLSPDPGLLHDYNEMMKALAEQNNNVHYLPIAENLHNYPSHDVFLDDCHLTRFGHNLVAEQIGQFIKEEQ